MNDLNIPSRRTLLSAVLGAVGLAAAPRTDKTTVLSRFDPSTRPAVQEILECATLAGERGRLASGIELDARLFESMFEDARRLEVKSVLVGLLIAGGATIKPGPIQIDLEMGELAECIVEQPFGANWQYRFQEASWWTGLRLSPQK